MWADESPRFRRLCWLPGFLAGRKRCSQDQGLLSSVFFRSSTLLQAVVTTDELVQRLSWIQVPTGSSAVPRMRLWLPCSSGYQQGLFLGCVCVCVCVCSSLASNQSWRSKIRVPARFVSGVCVCVCVCAVPWPAIRPVPPALGTQHPNH